MILLLLASAKKFCVLERMVQRGEWDYAITKPSDTIHGKTLGLVGCGNIARAVARKAKVFDMDIIGCDPGVTEQEVAKYGIHLLPQEKVLQDSDFLSLHAPLNRYTKHMGNPESDEAGGHSHQYCSGASGRRTGPARSGAERPSSRGSTGCAQ